MAIISK